MNNAGFAVVGSFELQQSEIERQMHTNVYGLMNVAAKFFIFSRTKSGTIVKRRVDGAALRSALQYLSRIEMGSRRL